MDRPIVWLIGAYHVILVIVIAYLFFELWPAPWPPPLADSQVAVVTVPVVTKAPDKDNAGSTAATAPKPATVNAAIAQDVLAGQARTAEAAKEPKKYSVSLFWGCVTFSASFEQRLILIVLLAGGLGAYIHAASSLADFVGNQKFQESWVLWYVLRPLIGMALAVVLYVVFRAGFLSVSAASSEVVNIYGITAIAALAGLFSKQAADKLNEIFTTAFRTAKGLGDATRKHKMYDDPTITAITPQTIARGATPVSLTIKGSGFSSNTTCKFNGAARTMNYKNESEIQCVLDATDTAIVGTYEVAVHNPEADNSATGHVTVQ